MNKLDVRDWFVMGLIAALAIVGCVYIFKFPSDTAFGIWAGVIATLVGGVHWINVQDSKTRDAQ